MHRYSLKQKFSCLSFLCLCVSHTQAQVLTLGATEGINVSSEFFCARIDTGAATSSIHATDIKLLKEKGETVVSFRIKGCFNDRCYDEALKRPLLRYQTVTQAAGTSKRPVVALYTKIRDTIHGPYAFSLTDRSSMTYPVLIGRNILDASQVRVNVNFNPSCVAEYGFGFVHQGK